MYLLWLTIVAFNLYNLLFLKALYVVVENKKKNYLPGFDYLPFTKHPAIFLALPFRLDSWLYNIAQRDIGRMRTDQFSCHEAQTERSCYSGYWCG
jgi:hypothetical protein